MSGRRNSYRWITGPFSGGLLFMCACFGPLEYDTYYSELESVWQYLKAYSIYQDSSLYNGRIPDDPFRYSDPSAMMRAVQDTLKGSHYTVYGMLTGAASAPEMTGATLSPANSLGGTAAARTTVFIDTLTDSTARITIIAFKEGEVEGSVLWDHTYTTFLSKLSAVRTFPYLIIDLRGNGGGDIDPTKSIVDAFLPARTSYLLARERVYDTDRRTAHTDNWHHWITDSLVRSELKNKKVTILMDHNSASASEILIAALKQCLGATLVGSRTYGKGIGQIKIPRRDRPWLQITFLQMQGMDSVGAYHGVGIEPDVPASGDETQTLLTAVRVHETSANKIRTLRKRTVDPTPIGAYRFVQEW